MGAVGLPDSFFTAPAHWRWLIVFYFFIGGIAGGAYFLAALMDLRGRPGDRALAGVAYRIAFPAVVVSGLLLVADLTRPLRFWHMLLESQTWQPMLKWWSPMTLGSWALLLFGLSCGVSFLAALAESGGRRWRWLGPFRPPHRLGIVWITIGAVLGLFMAGYTGVLLSVTNRPPWTETNLLGLLFVLSGASTAAALLILLARRRRWTVPAVEALIRFDAWVIGAELVALVALIATVGGTVLSRVWLNGWGALLVGVMLFGMVLPLVVELWPRRVPGFGLGAAAILVLVGGFLLRVVMVLGPDSIRLATTLGRGGPA